MKKSWKKLAVGSALGLILAGSLAGCSGLKGDATKKKEGASDSGAPTLLMYQIGDKPDNYDELMKVANKKIEAETGVQLNLQYIGWGDYEKKMSVITSSGENYDIALANNYVTNAQKGAYADLTELAPKLAKDAYDMLDPAYIKGNLIDGKLYAFPVNANVFAEQVLTFNKQFLDKYNLDISNVKSYQDIGELLKVVKEKEPTVTPLAAGQGFKVESDMDYPITNGMPFAIDLLGDDSKIINQYDNDRMKANLKTMHEYYQAGYIAQDAATSNTDHPLEGKTWFIRQETQGPYDYGDTILTTAAGQPLVSKPVTLPIKTTGAAQMANFVVSSNSKNKEKAVEVLGLINSNPELLNGLVYGIEGEAWEKVGDNQVKLLDGYQPKTHMSAWNTGNNKIIYVQDSITEDQIAERDKKIGEAEQSPILGFNFNTESVKSEITNIANVMNQYIDGLNTGTLDPDKAIPEMNAKLEKAGLDKVQTEMQKQYDAFQKE
ncbi:ABC transporter substrate-binding protein [Carnobacterium maltaromaticum]|uniref:ABC transporter substrate-binding protein n=1 Tax=Carnobacterium maltaromaticum TaxID=2751 RepID=UPI00295E2BC1|nr:ABC transporter substrate-binding protein [Carnobacterium maltaromaticum]